MNIGLLSCFASPGSTPVEIIGSSGQPVATQAGFIGQPVTQATLTELF